MVAEHEDCKIDFKAKPDLMSSAMLVAQLQWLVQPLLRSAIWYRLQKVTSLDRIGSKVLSPSNPSSTQAISGGTPGSGSASALKTPRLDAGLSLIHI